MFLQDFDATMITNQAKLSFFGPIPKRWWTQKQAMIKLQEMAVFNSLYGL